MQEQGQSTTKMRAFLPCCSWERLCLEVLTGTINAQDNQGHEMQGMTPGDKSRGQWQFHMESSSRAVSFLTPLQKLREKPCPWTLRVSQPYADPRGDPGLGGLPGPEAADPGRQGTRLWELWDCEEGLLPDEKK